jgi:hypothetical protein
MSRLLLLALTALLWCTGCTSPESNEIPSQFDRSFAAALIAAQDIGMQVRSADPDTGEIHGVRAGVRVAIQLQQQPNGDVRVEFTAPGSTEANPKLSERWFSAYQRRMGR